MNDRQLLETISKKLDCVADDVRTYSYKVDKIETKVDQIEAKVDKIETKIENFEAGTTARFDASDHRVKAIADKLNLIAKQFTAVTSKVLENDQRLGSVESRVALLEGEAH